MSNILSTLIGATNSLQVYDRALNVIQNNVANSATPGYAKQVQSLQADRFIPEQGFIGGVSAGAVVSYRSEYAEEAVRAQEAGVGFSEQRASDLERIEPLFSPIAGAGLPDALSKFFQSFSQVAVSPNDATARQNVLDRAALTAQAFNQAAVGIQSSRESADQQISSTVDSINQLLERIQEFNVGRRTNASAATDSGVDANLHQALEDLAKLVDFKAIEAPDRSLTVLLGGSQLAVIGDHSFPLSTDIANSSAKILNAQGADVTTALSSGQLGALLEHRNVFLKDTLADLDTLASSFANAINSTLAGGLDQNGQTPTTPLFALDSNYPALRLQVNSLATSDLALASASAPGGSGNALDIAGLSKQRLVNNFTFTEFFGNIGSKVGRALTDARDQHGTQSSLLTQAETLREQTQGVSLDEEATQLMVFQRAYQASSSLIKTINEMTETLLGLLR